MPLSVTNTVEGVIEQFSYDRYATAIRSIQYTIFKPPACFKFDVLTPKQKRVIGAAMVIIGLLQASYGSLNDELLYAFLGLTYALVGVAYIRVEGYTTES